MIKESFIIRKFAGFIFSKNVEESHFEIGATISICEITETTNFSIITETVTIPTYFNPDGKPSVSGSRYINAENLIHDFSNFLLLFGKGEIS